MPTLIFLACLCGAGVLLGHAQDLAKVPASQSDFRSFLQNYPLKPVQDYTFLGTERSREKTIVSFNGRIVGWFDPVRHVPWVQEAITTGSFSVDLINGYLPAVRYVYRRNDSTDSCEMTAFAADEPTSGTIHIYARLVEKVSGKPDHIRCFKLPESEPISNRTFDGALDKLRDQWRDFFQNGNAFVGVDPDLLNAAKASLVRALITFTGTHPHYGVKSYGDSVHDGFPPTIIALVHCLLDWGQTQKAQEYLSAYFDQFVNSEGRFLYYGPSLAEYGQMLHLVARLDGTVGQSRTLSAVRSKSDVIRKWLWNEIDRATNGLLAGVPEADTRKEVDVYFHNNAWCWRGLRDIGRILQVDEAHCEAYRETILKAIEQFTDRSVSPPFISPVAHKLSPFAEMTQDDVASYTNYRYWLELISSGILPRAQMLDIIAYRKAHGGEIGGMTRFRKQADDWPIAEYALAQLSIGESDAVREILFSHIAGHTTPRTWTAYEQVSIDGNLTRKSVADYCVPSQLVIPRLLAAWWKATSDAPLLKVPFWSGQVRVDGQLNEPCYKMPPMLDHFVVAGQPQIRCPRTQAWLFWQREGLVLAFRCEDKDMVAAPASNREHDLDSQDRVELFLWSGNKRDSYLCLEIGVRGAIHDYSAKFYRKFDDNWSPTGWQHASKILPNGYQVEAVIPAAALEQFGFHLNPGFRWRAGLFRADFASDKPNDPVWITWVDAKGPEPDFHVETSFGRIVLGEKAARP